MKYRIRALKNGECQVRDYITFSNTDSQETSTFYLYIWLIEGGERPMIVETGPADVEGFNRATEAYIPGGVVQMPDEVTPNLMRKAGVDPKDVSHVFVTHLHGDHFTYYPLFENAQLVVNRRGFLEALMGIPRDVMVALARRWPESLRLVEDEEVMPGIRTFWVGGHSICSQAIAVETNLGTAIITGDVVYLYRNIEENIPIASANRHECIAAMERIRREADVILPAHDPLVMERFPNGEIG